MFTPKVISWQKCVVSKPQHWLSLGFMLKWSIFPGNQWVTDRTKCMFHVFPANIFSTILYLSYTRENWQFSASHLVQKLIFVSFPKILFHHYVKNTTVTFLLSPLNWCCLLHAPTFFASSSESWNFQTKKISLYGPSWLSTATWESLHHALNSRSTEQTHLACMEPLWIGQNLFTWV